MKADIKQANDAMKKLLKNMLYVTLINCFVFSINSCSSPKQLTGDGWKKSKSCKKSKSFKKNKKRTARLF